MEKLTGHGSEVTCSHTQLIPVFLIDLKNRQNNEIYIGSSLFSFTNRIGQDDSFLCGIFLEAFIRTFHWLL